MRIVTIDNYTFATTGSDTDLHRVAAKWKRVTKVHTTKSLVNYLRLKDVDASILKSDLLDTDVRNMKGVSNSALSRLKNKLMGIEVKFPVRAGVFGQAFHEMILEPKNFNFDEYNLRNSEIAALKQMAFSFISNKAVFQLVNNSEKEVSRNWIEKKSKILCKGKLDFVYDSVHVGDLKTTSAKSKEAFIASLTKYDYDRQAAFYINSGAKRFHFVGIQKRKPYAVFHVSYYCNSKFIGKGKQKFQFLLDKYQASK